MEENKKIKINLKTIVMLIIVSVIVLISIVAVIIKLKEKQILQILKNYETSSITKKTPTQEQVNNNDFDIKFLQLENNKENIIYSPLSIKYALNMLNEGANGKTKEQIENVIKNITLPKYSNIEKTLSLANCIYVRDIYKKYVSEDYKNTLIEKYNAEINYDSFENANNVNKWIENKTLGIIKNMLDDGIVGRVNTEMLLINALAIDMEWEDSFECKDTQGKEFNLADGSKMNATTLKKETSSENILYYKDENITSLTMNLKKYEDTNLEFTAIMPNEDLAEYINTFTIDKFNDITKKSKPASTTEYGINISIPKFSFDYKLNLKNDLQRLGITEAFDGNKADFTNISNTGLFVSDALHKANIDFTERGVKAAAVTVMAMTDNYIMINENKPEEIKFDKPFLYVISDKTNGEIWFLGTVYEPNSWEADKEEYSKSIY